jgi:hypothetical protein
MRYSKPFTRLRHYLRSHGHDVHIVHGYLFFKDIRFEDLPEDEYFLIQICNSTHYKLMLPWCEPDTALSKAYTFRNWTYTTHPGNPIKARPIGLS